MTRETTIIAGVTVLVFGVLGFLIFQGSKPVRTFIDPNSALYQKIARADSHATGPASAKVTLVEFGDYQCPACAYVAVQVTQLVDGYKGNPDFRFIFRNFPLNTIHKNAQSSAEAAEAAGAQGKFWEMHDIIYEKQSEWSESSTALDIFSGYAQKLGLNVTKFKQDMQSHAFATVVSSDAKDGIDLGVNATPTFYMNGETMVGVPSMSDLKAKIDDALKK